MTSPLFNPTQRTTVLEHRGEAVLEKSCHGEVHDRVEGGDINNYGNAGLILDAHLTPTLPSRILLLAGPMSVRST